MSRYLALFCVFTLVSACAGRSPEPVQIAQRSDLRLSCTEIDAEISANNDQIASLLSEEDGKRAQNFMAVAGAILIFPPLLFAMDFQDAAGTERVALQQRQKRLARLSSRRCGGQRQLVAVDTSGRVKQESSNEVQPPRPGDNGNAGEIAALAQEARAAVSLPPVPGSPPLFEGSSYSAFTPEQISSYCEQNWTTRFGPGGRTEYNPCTQRSAFR